ncbi:regulatory protein RecX [Psychrobacter sp. 16-MNA-CIBAN-0192]|uniref:regulatory protein RecX n=1 Tax=Psychrobacter sp. 16-MNA-CIBAN-0192 TaxID=3140448 RepID=UPI00331863A0
MEIKTLAEILTESDTDSVNLPVSKIKKSSHKKPSTNKKAVSTINSEVHAADVYENYHDTDSDSFNDSFSSNHSGTTPNKNHQKSKKRKKRFHPAAHFTVEPTAAPAYQPPAPQSIKEMLAEVKRDIHGENDISENHNATALAQNQRLDPTLEAENEINHDVDTDNLPSALKAYLRSPEQRQADIDAIKAESRLRWLAFYYLSRREYGKAELRQKLLDKEQDPDKIDALLDEFEEKGYQSDYRTTLMLIRESIRKGRGRGHIKQEFYKKKVVVPSNIDELIDMANAESDEFRDFVDGSEDSLIGGVDWLKLAVTARTKKYGATIPSEQKAKARQLRFLQYRGFDMDICFQALSYTLDTLDERF